VQPFLGTICSTLMVSDIGLESIYLVVGSSKLIATGLKLERKSLSGLSRLLEICLSRTSSPGDELKNCIPRTVHHIRRTGIYRFKFTRNSGFNIGFQRKRICLLTSHCSPRTHSAPDISASKSKLTQFDRLDKFVLCFSGNAPWPQSAAPQRTPQV
jgi:hypothetical protein